MRTLFAIPFLLLAVVIDAATFVMWALMGVITVALGVVFGTLVFVKKALPFVPGVALLGIIAFGITQFGAWTALGLVPFVLMGVVNSKGLIDAMHTILKALYIRPLETFQRQHQQGDTAFVTFVASSDEFFSIRRAANLAGIWFSRVKWEPVGLKYVYKVWLVEKRED